MNKCCKCGKPTENTHSYKMVYDVVDYICPDCQEIKDMQPICPTCNSNSQVWVNQISGKLKCHRFGCETDIEPSVNVQQVGGKTINAPQCEQFLTWMHGTETEHIYRCCQPSGHSGRHRDSQSHVTW